MRIPPKIKLFVLISLALFSILLHAEEYQAETDFFGEAPVILTVSRMNKPLSESPASVTVIDRQMIRNSGAREIADLFRMVPGFVVGHLRNNRPVVTYHGFGLEYPRELQVLIDGRSVFIPSFGGVPWDNLPLLIQDIERIEIIRGPNSVTYGANAFLATINIITRNAAEDLGGSVSVTQDLDSNSSEQNIYMRYGNQIEDFDWRITAGREKDDGFANRIDTKLVEKLNIRTDFLTSYNQFWSLQAGLNQMVFTHGELDDVTDPVRDEDVDNDFINIKWELVENSVQTTVKLTHTRQDVKDSFDVVNPAYSGHVSFDRESVRDDLEVYQNRTMSDQLSVNYGISARKDKVTSFFLFHDNLAKTIDTNNFFSSVEWKPLESLIIDLGLLIENTNLTRQEKSYRLSILKKIDQHTIRFVSSSAKRNPILWELEGNITFDILIDPEAPPPYDAFAGMTVPFEIAWINSENLISESILSHEIGLFSQFLDQQLTTDIKIFRYEISDQLTEKNVVDPLLSPFDDDYRSIINGGSSEVEGIELSFNYSPINERFRLYGGISALHSKSFSQDFKRSVPKKILFSGGHYQFNSRQQLSATLYSVDTFSWVDRTESIDGYTKLDLRYQYTIDPKNDINLEIIGQNLAEEYSDYRSRDIHEQSILIRLSARF